MNQLSKHWRWSFVVACLPVMVLFARVVSPAWAPYQSQPSTQNKEVEKRTDKDVAAPQQFSKKDLDRGHRMLDEIKADLKEFYYDPKFRGMDLDTRFKTARDKVDASQSLGEMFGIIGQLLIEFDDSHLFFIPPLRTERTDYGWDMQMIGNECLVTNVKKDSDAAAKGLKIGDKVLWVDGYTPVRDNFWKLNYLLNTLRPQPAIYVYIEGLGETQPRPLTLVAKQDEQLDLLKELFGKQEKEEKDPPKDGPERETHFRDHRFYEFADDLIIWQMPKFDLPEDSIDKIMREKVASRRALILDLRGNRGGYEVTLLRLLGHFFDHDTKLGAIQRRNGMKQLIAKSRGEKIYQGKIVVLVDSESASSAEIFARVIQIEKRGSVIGDVTAGKVMRALRFSHPVDKQGMMTGNIIGYAISVTDADIVMSDGHSLERIGVTPDELLLPKPEDLAARRDPALARAAEMVGFKLSAEKAGTIFPPREPKEKPKNKEKEKKDERQTSQHHCADGTD